MSDEEGAWGASAALSRTAKPGCGNFTSDNTAGCMPEVLTALTSAAASSQPSYGLDSHTKRLNVLFSQVFETPCTVFVVATGTSFTTPFYLSPVLHVLTGCRVLGCIKWCAASLCFNKLIIPFWRFIPGT